ncbi:MAG: hypothetical protein ABFC77_01575 [Thermoguttaceae bacterium]
MNPLPPEADASEPFAASCCARFSVADLETRLRAADPSAFLALPRLLRRVIKQDRHLGGFGVWVPHRKSYTIGRDALLRIVDRAELGLAGDADLPETVILLARPSPRKLAAMSDGDALVLLWRMLFHAKVHLALDAQTAAGKLTAPEIWRRVQQIGPATFESIGAVLARDHWLLPPRDPASIYAEFAAVYLELRHFAASCLPRYFPDLESFRAVDQCVGQDVDAKELFEQTRLPGAPDPKDRGEPIELVGPLVDVEPPEPEPSPEPEIPSETKYRWLMRKSQRPAAAGNVVRAAVYRARARRCAPPELVDRATTALQMDVYRLTRRLQAALEQEESDPHPWQSILLALVEQTSDDTWTVEARLLYDLQRACVDYEREIYTVDLAEWLWSWGRRPLRRRLPNQRDALMLKHLRSAARRLPSARLSAADRRQLARLLRDAEVRVERRLREQLRPQIVAAFDEVGLSAHNPPERVARGKLVEELLDQIGLRGFLTMGDLRDAISRNHLKLPDLSEPRDFLQGDSLLQADRKLALKLDGVYRRGECYLRGMQRLSSVAFGTPLGRFVTRFVAVPFGGAYVALAGVHHVWEIIHGVKHPPVDPDLLSELPPPVESGFSLTSPVVVFSLGLFLLCLINSAWFRRAVAAFFRTVYHVVHSLVIEPIGWLFRWPLLRRILSGRLFVLTFRFGLKPLFWTAVVWLVFRRGPIDRASAAISAAGVFLGFNLLLNSRVGRTAEEVAVDGVVQAWHQFGLRAITGLFWWIVDCFKSFLETVERLMYAVDEWLRFRSGQGVVALAMKAVLGFFWFFIAYVLRFCVNVLIEPQINPIKHFPVVTVSHKLLLPLIPSFAHLLSLTLDKPLAWTVATAIITSIPGVFGFLVWELKENWRVYAANRRRGLSPAPIGSHGETMVRLLKPGFHSGTLPKRFAKLRQAERRARLSGRWQTVRKHAQTLHHIELFVRNYVERDFLALLQESRAWAGRAIALDEIWLGTASLQLIFRGGDSSTRLRVKLEVESDLLIAGLAEAGGCRQLSPRQQRALATALLGLYKSFGVDLVREQIASLLVAPTPPYDMTPQGLVVWPDGRWDVEVLYDLRDDAWIAPQSVRGLAREPMPTLQRPQILLNEVFVSWDDWVKVWNQDVAEGQPLDSLAPVCVLR